MNLKGTYRAAQPAFHVSSVQSSERLRGGLPCRRWPWSGGKRQYRTLKVWRPAKAAKADRTIYEGPSLPVKRPTTTRCAGPSNSTCTTSCRDCWTRVLAPP